MDLSLSWPVGIGVPVFFSWALTSLEAIGGRFSYSLALASLELLASLEAICEWFLLSLSLCSRQFVDRSLLLCLAQFVDWPFLLSLSILLGNCWTGYLF